jgi:membrane associated rhomboid family serine protease
MKVVEFIKRYISIFLISGVFFVLLSCVIFLTSINKPDYHGYAKGFTIIIFTLGLFLFIVDFILKQLIKDKFNLNFFEGVLLIFILVYFFKFFIQ